MHHRFERRIYEDEPPLAPSDGVAHIRLRIAPDGPVEPQESLRIVADSIFENAKRRTNGLLEFGIRS